MSFNLSVIAQDLNSAVTKANAAAPQSTTYSKTEVDGLLEGKANADNIGTMSSLATTDKSSLVAAINEVIGSKVSRSYYYTTTVPGTTTLEDTGVSYTVPAGDICRITAAIMYNGSAPQKIRITFKAMAIAETEAVGASDITVSASGITAPQVADQVVKVYGQWASSVGTNTVLLLVEKLN